MNKHKVYFFKCKDLFLSLSLSLHLPLVFLSRVRRTAGASDHRGFIMRLGVPFIMIFYVRPLFNPYYDYIEVIIFFAPNF